MPLETATTIGDLVATNPTGADKVLEGDNHIRLMKQVLLNSVADSGDLGIAFGTRADAVASVNLAQGKYVRTAGKTSVGDGQGGYYRVVAPGTGVPDDLNYIDLVGSTGQLELVTGDQDSTVTYERQIAVGGETVITSANAYTVGANNLQVYRNGIHQVTPTDYTEDSSTQFTLQTALTAGEKLDIYVYNVKIAQISAAQISFTPAGNVEATTMQAAIEELDTEKSATGHTHAYLDEALNLSDVVDAPTAFDNIKQSADTGFEGVARPATQAEADAGTAGQNLFITPNTLANYQTSVGTDVRKNVLAVDQTYGAGNAGPFSLGSALISAVGGDLTKSRLQVKLTNIDLLGNVTATAAGDVTLVAKSSGVELARQTYSNIGGASGLDALDQTFQFEAWPILNVSSDATQIDFEVEKTSNISVTVQAGNLLSIYNK